MPDMIEDDNGTFEPWYKLPPHIYCVRRIGALEKREYIAKRIRHHSNEVQIIQSLGMTKAPSNHIIQMLEIIKLEVTTLIVFPKLGSISEELQFGGRVLHGRLIDLSRDLARGLTFLHDNNVAHLDINPSNLGFTDNYCLQIFDFDISVQVNGEEERIGDYLGTEGWMAPEIGTRDGPRQLYSPIRADRYSCGRVFKVFADMNGEVDEGLGQFADKLIHPDPSKRPHLIGWCGPNNSVTLTQTNSAEMMDKTMVAEDEVMAEGAMVAEDEQKVMAPKRPRVGYGGEGFHQVPM
ncbi:kinase-like domain-containing protein [Lactarius hengduanensis]|nr:kinase-like domain-containing protein [Lactarius hengduanensis]